MARSKKKHKSKKSLKKDRNNEKSKNDINSNNNDNNNSNSSCNKTSNNNNKSGNKTSNNNSSNTGISEADLKSLDLLNIEKYAMILVFYSDYLSYLTTIEAIDLISNRAERSAQEEQELTIKIDEQIVLSVRLIMIARLMFLKVALARYDTVYNQKLNGEFPYSLEANELVVKSLTLKLVGDAYSLQAALEFLRRDGASFFGL
ncbi:hypothetical protein [Clostridium sp.]|uniref:hypothetical protein n=1 Tax=Clostridium sp. TaxID=1506 RepID=UPI003994E5F5